MTNVLDLSRNFCYNNNREVKARTTRRTRQAMASELQLPQHYVELDSQEMMYIDGGEKISLSILNSDITFYFGMFIGFTAEATGLTILAAGFFAVPFGMGAGFGIAATVAAAAATSMAVVSWSCYSSGVGALNQIKHLQAMGRNFSVYRYNSGLMVNYFVE